MNFDLKHRCWSYAAPIWTYLMGLCCPLLVKVSRHLNAFLAGTSGVLNWDLFIEFIHVAYFKHWDKRFYTFSLFCKLNKNIVFNSTPQVIVLCATASRWDEFLNYLCLFVQLWVDNLHLNSGFSLRSRHSRRHKYAFVFIIIF